MTQPIPEPTLVSTADAAYLLGMTPARFRSWAARVGLRATLHVRSGRSTHALWDADQVFEAEKRHAESGRRMTRL